MPNETMHPSELPVDAVFMGAQWVTDDMPALEGEVQLHKILLAFQLTDTGRVITVSLDHVDAGTVARTIYDVWQEATN